MKAAGAEQCVCSFVGGGEDLWAGSARHRLDINEITVLVIQDQHVGVSGTGWHEKTTCWIGEDLAGGGFIVGV
jgi:hypothetical protein